MPLEITITVCNRGSISLHYKGDTRLLLQLSGELKRLLDELTENARLEVGAAK